jgi:type IV secretion system protein VirB10
MAENMNERTKQSQEQDKEKSTSINRPLVMKVAGVALAVIVGGGLLFSNMGSKKETEKPVKTETASDVRPPSDLGRNIPPRAGENGTPINNTQFEPQFYDGDQWQGSPLSSPDGKPLPPPPAKQPNTVTSQTASTHRSSNEKTPEELALESPLIPEMQGNFGNKNKQPAGGGNPVNQDQPSGLPAGFPDPSALLGKMQNPLSGLDLGGLGGSGSAGYNAQNMQSDKQAFYPGGNSGETKDDGRFLEPASLFAGVIIPAVLITGVNTDLPGDLQARVTENIHDSLTGKYLLIPQGTILIAKYNSSISYAQSRVQIVWNTLIRPDGYLLELGGMNGVDAEGYSGAKGIYSENLFQYLKAAGIITLFTMMNAKINDQVKGGSDDSMNAQIMLQNQQVVNQLSSKLIDRALDIQPTIRIPSGMKVNIMLNKNIRLPPIADNPVSKKYERR